MNIATVRKQEEQRAVAHAREAGAETAVEALLLEFLADDGLRIESTIACGDYFPRCANAVGSNQRTRGPRDTTVFWDVTRRDRTHMHGRSDGWLLAWPTPCSGSSAVIPPRHDPPDNPRAEWHSRAPECRTTCSCYTASGAGFSFCFACALRYADRARFRYLTKADSSGCSFPRILIG